jgi:hypothetical protein
MRQTRLAPYKLHATALNCLCRKPTLYYTAISRSQLQGDLWTVITQSATAQREDWSSIPNRIKEFFRYLLFQTDCGCLLSIILFCLRGYCVWKNANCVRYPGNRTGLKFSDSELTSDSPRINASWRP